MFSSMFFLTGGAMYSNYSTVCRGADVRVEDHSNHLCLYTMIYVCPRDSDAAKMNSILQTKIVWLDLNTLTAVFYPG